MEFDSNYDDPNPVETEFQRLTAALSTTPREHVDTILRFLDAHPEYLNHTFTTVPVPERNYNTMAKNAMTFAQYAAYVGDIELLQGLIAKGADIKRGNGYSIMDFAVMPNDIVRRTENQNMWIKNTGRLPRGMPPYEGYRYSSMKKGNVQAIVNLLKENGIRTRRMMFRHSMIQDPANDSYAIYGRMIQNLPLAGSENVRPAAPVANDDEEDPFAVGGRRKAKKSRKTKKRTHKKRSTRRHKRHLKTRSR